MKLSFEEVEEILNLLPFVGLEVWGNTGHELQTRSDKISKIIEDRKLAQSSTGEE